MPVKWSNNPIHPDMNTAPSVSDQGRALLPQLGHAMPVGYVGVLIIYNSKNNNRIYHTILPWILAVGFSSQAWEMVEK